ncbi:ATP synthase subunit I [Aliiglaciecola lipolytica]|uniref:ATP synthase protein I n=1 Tax=Aliiglaciecola lipolytica E3 TaxID=1127673 RepID=K6XLW2_9ALTE|nr:ATP synthase subunit I [Aliiglaciecola lipolytica]GAC12666.1 ATP synthase protein I [Aliiglaciecola lipolytica E3]
MATSLTSEGRQLARKVLFFQSIVAIVCSILFAILKGQNSGISAFYGGITCLLPALVFAHYAFRYAGARQNKLVVRSFNRGSKIKFFLTIILFSLAFKWSEIEFLALLVTYLITTMAQWPIISFLHRVKPVNDV